MLNKEKCFGAMVKFGNCRGQVVEMQEDGRYEIIRYLDNGTFGGICYVRPEEITGIESEGTDDWEARFFLKRKVQDHLGF